MKEEDVKSVTDFFFKELNREIKECNHPFIYVKGLGTYALLVGKLKGTLKLYLGYLREKSINPKRKETLTAEIFELFRMRRMLRNQYKENKELKNAGKIRTNLERQLVSISGKE